MIYWRIASFIFLVAAAVSLPLVPVLFFSVVLVAVFPRFWESVVVAVLLDSLYFSPLLFSKFGLGFFTFTFVAALLITGKMKSWIGGENAISKTLVAVFGAAVFCLLLPLFYV